MSNILLVDDEPSIRFTIAEFLKRDGYQVFVAADYDSAAALIDNDIDAAVVDINLPRRSGIELLRELNSRETYVPVIMITGQPNLAQLPEIVRAGAYDFISKPVLKDVILNAVRRAVEKKRLVDEKRRLEQELKEHAEELERRVAERTAELAEAHQFLNIVLDSSTEYAIVAIDIEGSITLFNRGAERMFGYTAQEVAGRTPPGLIVEATDDERPFIKSAREAEPKGRHQLEMQMRRADATLFEASLVMTSIRKPDGRLIGYLSIIRDLTVEREHEEMLRQMQVRLAHNEKIAALGRVAAQVAHEVKNPLAGLHLYALHLRNKVRDKLAESELSLVDKIVDTINHLSGTAEQILSFARPVNLQRITSDLNRIISTTLQLLEPQTIANRINTELDLDPQGARGLLDESSLRSSLMNLLLNSIQAMPDGGKLTVKTRSADGRLRLTITDTGCGMSAEQARNMFEPFYTTKSKGLGLGMPYAQKVIEQHEGAIAVESRAGEGTRVEIELPMADDGR
jgi:PAS domain S-box-containing protein